MLGLAMLYMGELDIMYILKVHVAHRLEHRNLGMIANLTRYLSILLVCSLFDNPTPVRIKPTDLTSADNTLKDMSALLR